MRLLSASEKRGSFGTERMHSLCKTASVSNMAPRMKGRQREPGPLRCCSWGALLLNSSAFQGQPQPQVLQGQAARQRHLWGSVPAGELDGGLRAPAGCCLTQLTAPSCPSPSPTSLLSLGHFTCKYILQMVPGVSMTSPGNGKKTHCLNLGVGAQQLSENHLIRSREPGVLMQAEEELRTRTGVGHQAYR